MYCRRSERLTRLSTTGPDSHPISACARIVTTLEGKNCDGQHEFGTADWRLSVAVKDWRGQIRRGAPSNARSHQAVRGSRTAGRSEYYRPEILHEPNQVDRIENEARVGQEIAHPNVARIYEHEILRNATSKEIDQAFLVMEYVDGITLHKWLSMFHRISDRLLLRIFRQLVDGTNALHEKGVIHRDIKPTNILVSSTFQAKITDFGVVKVKDTPPGGSTPEDKFLGTIRNASPELLFGEKFDHRADLYSLGTVLFALLHGVEIFAAENQFARLIELKKHQGSGVRYGIHRQADPQ